jgi:hypothetical protein
MIGFGYDFDIQKFSGAGISHNQMLSVALTRRFGRTRTWLLRVGAGPAWLRTEQPASIGPSYGSMTYQASAELFKSFRSSGVSIAFDRSQTFSGVISDHFNDRYYMSYSRVFGRRLSTNFGAGYIRQAFGGTSDVLAGTSGWGRMDFRLGHNWSFFTSYLYLSQDGVFSRFGKRHTMLVGFRWSWNPENDPAASTRMTN